MIEQASFIKYNLQKKEDTFTIKLNVEERRDFEGMKAILRQAKDSTAMKQLARVGSKVLLEPKLYEIIETIIENNRKNKRTNAGVEYGTN